MSRNKTNAEVRKTGGTVDSGHQLHLNRKEDTKGKKWGDLDTVGVTEELNCDNTNPCCTSRTFLHKH